MEEICTEENVESSFKLICSHLEILGIPLKKYEPDNIKENFIYATNYLWAMIKLQRKNIDLINKSNDEISALKSEVRRLNQTVRTKDSQITCQQKEVEVLKSKYAGSEQENLGLTSQINLLKKECNKLITTSDTDRKVYLKNITDQKEIIRNLNDRIFKVQSDESQCKVKEKRNIVAVECSEKIMRDCIQTLDNTIQNLLGEIAAVRSSFMKLFLDLHELAIEVYLKRSPPDALLKTDEPELIFQLPHEQFLQAINSNITVITNFLQAQIL